MINILVTGSSGQLGNSIKELSKLTNQYRYVFTDSKTLDITKEKEVLALFEEIRFDYCINCAAYTAADKAEEEIELCYSVNTDALNILAKICAATNCVLIHISTDFVFDGKLKHPYSEKDIENPLNVYGFSKLEGEKAVQRIIKEHFIIRTPWLYSEYGGNFLNTMLKLGIERDSLSVVSDQIGTPTYTGDLASFVIGIIEGANTNYGLYHYSSEGLASWFDFAKAIFEIRGIDVELTSIKSKHYPSQAQRPSYSVFSTSKIKEVFYMNTPNWRDSLSICIERMRG